MTSHSAIPAALALAATLALGACGGGSNDTTELQTAPAVTASEAGSVPTSAMSSPEALVSFQQGLAVDDRIEPLSLQQLLPPLSDTTEPVSVGGG